MPKKVLFLVPYPLNEAPSQRFRFEQYFELLIRNDIEFKVQPFLSVKKSKIFFSPGRLIDKGLVLLVGIFLRIKMIIHTTHFDYIFIHREAAPVGPPLFEWILARVLKKKIVFDFDDAIWLSDQQETKLASLIKCRNKVKKITSWAYRISAGNSVLSGYAYKYNSNVVLNPTTIDTNWHNPEKFKIKKDTSEIIVGWTGSHSTLKYLSILEPVLQSISRKFKHVEFLIIADKPPPLKLQSLTFVPWNEATEISDLMRIDIGIMPLPDDQWSRGKCGFKLLQYLSLEIPAVASPVGVNTSIIEDGVNGFLANTQEEWENALTTLIKDPTLRSRMGKKGREKVIERYSVSSNSSNFLSLFD
ncbi:MAG: glycosyltransferase family 4 protein [Chryseolinea sp.]